MNIEEEKAALSSRDRSRGLATLVIDAVDADAILHGREFTPNQTIAKRYTVSRLLGRGGMGAVYAVQDSEFEGETVALKTILPELDQHVNAIRRFKREIQLARRVTHANACRIFDVGYHQFSGGRQVAFVTMEYLEGETLSEQIHRVGCLTTTDSFSLIMQICDAMSAIHGAGIIHRDFKSSNVMIVDANGKLRAVVTDFGLACLNATESNHASSITASGSALGSPPYMAPEQVEGKPATAATDVYALGVVMFEMVTGRLPFEGNTPLAVALKRLHEAPVSPREFVPTLDPVWEAVIMRCLERAPSARFQSVSEVARALANDKVEMGLGVIVPSANDAVTTILPTASEDHRHDEQGIHAIHPKILMTITAIVLLSIVGWYSLGHRRPALNAKTVAVSPITTESSPTTSVLEPTPSRASAIPERGLLPVITPQDFDALQTTLTNDRSPSYVALSTKGGKAQFIEGESIEYDVTVDADGYLYLLVFSGRNIATCIFPNAADPNNKVVPGTFAVPRNKNYQFPVQAPFGMDLHVAVLSKRKLNLGKKDVYSWEEAIREIDGPGNTSASRGVGVRASTKPWQAASILLKSTPQ